MDLQKIRIAAFAVVFLIFFCTVSWFFRPPYSHYSIIAYELPNTIDVLFIGSSHVYCGINPSIFWQEEGLTAFNFCSSGQPMWASYHFILEALKKQKPFLIIMDAMYIVRKDKNDYNPSNFQTGVNAFPQSLNRGRMIITWAEKDQQLPFLLDLLNYHTRWRGISSNSALRLRRNYMRFSNYRYKGYLLDYLFKTADIPSEQNNVIYPSTDELADIPEKAFYYLNRIIELSKEKSFKLLLIKTPTSGSLINSDVEKLYNTVRRIAEENGIAFIDFHYKEYRDAMEFDFSTDLFDIGHLNASGAEKLSRYMAKYIKDEFDIPDRRGIPAYKSWDEAAKGYFLFEAMEKARLITDFPSYLEGITDLSQNLIFITGVRGDASATIIPIAWKLSPQGVTMDLADKHGFSYICIYEPSSGYLYEDVSFARKIKKSIYKDSLPINLEVVSEGYMMGDTASIKIRGVEHAKNMRGLNVVIYDKELERVFDSFSVDTHGDDTFEIRR